MLIHIKGCYSVLGKIHSNSERSRLRFSVPLEGDKPAVTVDIIPNENSVEAFDEMEVSKEMWDVLQTDVINGAELPAGLQAELSSMTSRISAAARKLLYLIKYCFGNVELSEKLMSIKGNFWSLDQAEWKQLPMVLTSRLEIRTFVNLNEDTARILQKYMEDDMEPFLALKHLQRARTENSPRHRWIDATLAAELAIKEFLIRFKPDMETFLLEVPSPPLHELYGAVLESFVQERSPKLREIAKGVEIRNRFVHKPKEEHISVEQASKYVQDIEIAIYHLLHLLYPDDACIEVFRKPKVTVGGM